MVMAAHLSQRLGLVDAAFVQRLTQLIAKAGLPVVGPDLGADVYLHHMRVDKKAEAGDIRFVLIDTPGSAIVRGAPDALVAEVQSWRVTSPGLASSAVEDAIASCAGAIRNVAPPAGISAGLVDKLTWTVDRLMAGEVIASSPWQDGTSRKARRRER